MRLLFCVNRDLYANIALNVLLPALAEDDCFVLFSDGVGRRRQTASPTLDFMSFFERDLPNRHLFPLYEGMAAGPENRLKTFTQLSRAYGVSMQGIEAVNAEAGLCVLRDWAPDLIVSIRFGQIFKAPVLAIPRYGVINLHSGLLPEYRGILATFWSLLHGATEYGFTLHHISDGTIDTGAVIERHSLPVNAHGCLFSHIVNLYPPGAQSILRAIQSYKRGTVPASLPQAEMEGRYFGLPEAAAFDAFHQAGHRLLDPSVYFQWLSQYGPCQSLPLPVNDAMLQLPGAACS